MKVKRKDNEQKCIGINVGVSKETVMESRKAIMDILRSGSDQSTIVSALEVLGRLCSVNGASISNCSVNMSARSEQTPDN